MRKTMCRGGSGDFQVVEVLYRAPYGYIIAKIGIVLLIT